MITWVLLSIFIVGYLMIVFEHQIHIDKTGSALVTGVLIWTTLALHGNFTHSFVEEQLSHHFFEITGILLFLWGAMTVVEIIDRHEGFVIITDKIKTRNKVKLLWIISWLTFFISALLDNLTTTIVMVSILQKIIPIREDRLKFSGMVIISANAGGVWSVLGDVTSTMLWIQERVSPLGLFKSTFIPSVISCLIPLIILSLSFKGNFEEQEKIEKNNNPTSKIILILGLLFLIAVPIFKIYTHLPPFLGMMLSLGLMWICTEIIHRQTPLDVKTNLSVASAMSRIDTPSMLFFVGILTAIAGLQTAGILKELSHTLDTQVGNSFGIAYLIGVFSAIVDNVPLVAASTGMYALEDFPTDAAFWSEVAFCAGTGGSMLIIGSAAGVAVMGIEKIDFFWYLKNIGWLAFIGYSCGALLFLI